MWTIDQDIIGEGRRNGRIYRRGAEPHYQDAAQIKHLWRVKDADGEVYAIGRSDDDSSFAPLDYFMADAGATDIEYFDPVRSVWVPL